MDETVIVRIRPRMTTNDTTSDHGKHKYFSLVLKWPSHQDEDDAPFGHASKKAIVQQNPAEVSSPRATTSLFGRIINRYAT
eukprot:scaffold1652_cov177-Alexandrium_tamarense.AAC.7